jgi:RNA polymerase sigma-70 factor (sigma-E family)
MRMGSPIVREPSTPPALNGRSEMLTTLFDQHYVHLVRTARLLVDDRETAEDVVMEAFISLHRRWRTLRNPNDAHRYLVSSVLNGARSQLRRRRVRRLHEGDPPPDAAGGEDIAMVGSDHATLMHALRSLPPRQRHVLVMRFYLDLSEVQVADELSISVGSVKQHSSRGLAALARSLEVNR